ncbi:hypothetical protein ED733_006592 [Metarhizium rileyi]|uniref:Uncharacterized protein n=1 Tax=Metarhizium rileyi (strain RCEF 4871) TaxID=1649241 RepID=A0A5C6GJ89_METRR|nr:hypothetical protein ED733_006592 [Metarhizium rileyi]
MHWLAVITSLLASFPLDEARDYPRGNLLYINDGPGMNFYYTTNQASDFNWIGIWKAADVVWPEEKMADMKDIAVGWHYAPGDDGEVRLPIDTEGKYKAFMFPSWPMSSRILAGPEEFQLGGQLECDVDAAANAKRCSDGETKCFGTCVSSTNICNSNELGMCPWHRPAHIEDGLCCNGGTDGTQGGENCPSTTKTGLCCNGGTDGTQGGENCSLQKLPCNLKIAKRCFGRCIAKDKLCNGNALGVCPAEKPSIFDDGLCCNGGTDGTKGGLNCSPQVPPCNPKLGKECFGICVPKKYACKSHGFGVCPANKPSVWDDGMCCNGGTDGTKGDENCSPQIPPCNPDIGKECLRTCIFKDDAC